jgi:hypothetical protein
MHSCIEDIDIENKLIKIKNTGEDRGLEASLPFDWIIAYAKSDILSKKKLNQYNVRGFYYNSDMKNAERFDTEETLRGTIQYEVRISGNSFFVKDIENRIKDLFLEHSKLEVPKYIVYNTKDYELARYDKHYLRSFYHAKELVKKVIESEFPGVNVEIHIDSRNARLMNKIIKRTANYYNNYELFYNRINNLIKKKSTYLLHYISNLISYIDSVSEESKNPYENMRLFNEMMNDRKIEYKTDREIVTNYKNNLHNVRSILLNLCALATLIINDDKIYIKHYKNVSPEDIGMVAYSVNPYLDCANKIRREIKKILSLEDRILVKNNELANCVTEESKNKVTQIISDLNNEIIICRQNIINLETELKNNAYIDSNNENIDDYMNEAISDHDELLLYYAKYKQSNSLSDRKLIEKDMMDFLDDTIATESKYIFSKWDIKEMFRIIRNSFAHIGRVNIIKNREQYDDYVVLNDYDSNNNKSGFVKCQYRQLIDILTEPLNDNNLPKTRIK